MERHRNINLGGVHCRCLTRPSEPPASGPGRPPAPRAGPPRPPPYRAGRAARPVGASARGQRLLAPWSLRSARALPLLEGVQDGRELRAGGLHGDQKLHELGRGRNHAHGPLCTQRLRVDAEGAV